MERGTQGTVSSSICAHVLDGQIARKAALHSFHVPFIRVLGIYSLQCFDLMVAKGDTLTVANDQLRVAAKRPSSSELRLGVSSNLSH